MKKPHIIKRVIPCGVKGLIRDFLGISALHERIDRLDERLLESKEEILERSKTRWRQSEPNHGLTWKKELTGESFIAKVRSYEVFSDAKRVLEIGPGYGRLLRTCLERNVPFKEYVAVDIGAKNITYLRESFSLSNVHFIHGDVEKVSFDQKFDIVLSSLTLKHLAPSFEAAIRNVARCVNPGGMFFFDLIEGKKRYFEEDGITYIRWYTKPEVIEILDKASLELVTFDQVQHDAVHSRLLVVATKRE